VAHGHGPEGGGGAAGAVAAWLGWFVACAVMWLALVDNTHVPELVAGAGVAILGATAALVVRQQRRVVLRPSWRWLAAAWRPLSAYPRDLWRLARALPGRGGGRFYAVPATSAIADDPQSAARRVLVQASGSFAPNTYAIGTDYDKGLLLVHQLAPSDDPAADSDPLRLR
jgi:hypothetical protein